MPSLIIFIFNSEQIMVLDFIWRFKFYCEKGETDVLSNSNLAIILL